MSSRSVQTAKSNAEHSLRVRVDASIKQKEDSRNAVVDSDSYDLTTYVDSSGVKFYPYMFSKTLEHDPVTGYPKKDDVDKILDALRLGTKDSLDLIKRHPQATRKLEGVLAHNSVNMIGLTSSAVKPTEILQIDSIGAGFEMAEVYGKMLVRDIPFNSWVGNTDVDKIVADLNKYSNKTTAPVNGSGNITTSNLFRGRGIDELKGPFISQLLLHDIPYGNLTIEQKYRVEEAARLPGDVVPGIDEWLKVQNSEPLTSVSNVPTLTRFTNDALVLGGKVHNDPLYAFYYAAALILLGNGVKPENATLDLGNSTAWTTGSGPDILSAVSHVSKGALLCAWNTKWNIGMKIRPEVYAQRLDLARQNVGGIREATPKLDTIWQNNEIAQEIKALVQAHHGGSELLLHQQYPEGSPTHPSFVAGHAAVSGACTTILKAMLKVHDDTGSIKWSAVGDVKQSNVDGSALEDYTGADATEVSIVGELNKLASNIAVGRDFAGVHFRSDGDIGIQMGEEYAISYLIDLCKSYDESLTGSFKEYNLQKFSGEFVKISKDGVKPA